MGLVKKELLNLLVCPVDKSQLQELEAAQKLECTQCGRQYDVKNGIPIMLLENSNVRNNSKKATKQG